MPQEWYRKDQNNWRYFITCSKLTLDCYVAVCGITEQCNDHAQRMIEFACNMLTFLNEFNDQYDYGLKLRIGIHCGSVIAGVLGAKKLQYDIFGETVDKAKL